MATSTTALVTVGEFRRMEDPPGFRLELHNGEVVRIGVPIPRTICLACPRSSLKSFLRPTLLQTSSKRSKRALVSAVSLVLDR